MRIRETFMGKIVPPTVHGSGRELVEACRADDWNKACSCVDCTRVDCAECFFSRPTGNNTADDLKRFADEYEKSHPSAKPEEDKDKDKGMPELKPGDVVIYECYPGDKKPHKLLHAGCAQYGITTNDSGDVILSSWGATSTDPKVVKAASAIYRPTELYYAISMSGLEAIAKLPLGKYPEDVNSSAKLIWKRNEEVKELTVDEISKLLGYKVKIVGSDK